MQIKAQQLAGALQKNLSPVYLISGDEPQQAGELADLIRKAALAQDYSNREIFFADKQFDWRQLTASANNLSIFADKKLIDLKLTIPPGQDGGKVLAAYCQKALEDTLLLIITGKITKETQRASWFQAIDKIGVIIQVWPLADQELLHWIQNRMQQKGMSVESKTVALLAERVEGNLMAAAQEVEKLYALYGAGKISPQQILEAVSDSSRYDVFKLVESVLAQKTNKILKILASLQAEGVASSLVLWALAREVRILVCYKAAASGEKETILRNNAMWGERKQLLEFAAKRLSHTELNRALVMGANAERQIKGQQQGDPWETLLQMCMSLSSASVMTQTS